MSDSVILDIAIGLVFVFLAVSLAITAGNELLASLLKWRAKGLAAGLRKLLGTAAGGAPDLLAAIYDHAAIRHLHNDAATSDRKAPAYIPPRLFAMALLDIALRPAGATEPLAAGSLAEMRATIAARREQLGQRVSDALITFIDNAQSDTRTDLGNREKVQENVEQWFAAGMDHVSDAYRRRTHLTGTVAALFVVSALNLDSIRIARTVANDSVLRQSLVAQAAAPARDDEVAERAQFVTADRMRAIQRDVESITQLGIPVGWDSESPRHDVHWWFKKILGLLLTGLAASLGAPFWLDFLKRVTRMRPHEQRTPAASRDG